MSARTWEDYPEADKVISQTDRYVCSECGTVCARSRRRIWDSTSRAWAELTKEQSPPIALNTARYGFPAGRDTHPLTTQDVQPRQKQGPSIHCKSCAKKKVDAAAAERKADLDDREARFLKSAREDFPDEAAVRKAARAETVRYYARKVSGWRAIEPPSDVRRIAKADGPAFVEAWNDEVDKTRAEILVVLREHFPELEED